MSEAFAGKKPEQSGFAGMPIEQTPSSLRWSLVDHVSKQDAELGLLRAENEKLRAALKPFADRYAYALKYCPDKERWQVGLDELRAAAAALKETGDE